MEFLFGRNLKLWEIYCLANLLRLRCNWKVFTIVVCFRKIYDCLEKSYILVCYCSSELDI